MGAKEYITIPQLAKLLGVSRIAIYNKVKKGEIPALRIGRNYAIDNETIAHILGKKVSERGKKQIDKAVRKTVEQYGEVLRKLSMET